MSFKVWATIMMLVALLVCAAVVGLAWKQGTAQTVPPDAAEMRQAMDAAQAAASAAADAAEAATRATQSASEPAP